MSGGEARRASLVSRVAALTPAQRRALARAVGGDGAAPGRLVACLTAVGDPPTADALDAFLEERLPEYMIPSRYVLLDRLPRNAAGKLDRNAVDPERGTDLRAGPPGLVAPRNETEARLVEIWKEVLGVDEISVHDDFFEIGGDSLLSIRAISRAGRAGIEVGPEAFFDAPTIAGIAAGVGVGGPEAEQGPVVGDAPLTPIQEWFFERVGEGRDRWNQAVMLRAPASADRDVLAEAVHALVLHHDALRLRFVREDGSWRQRFEAAPPSPPFRAVDLTDVPAPDHAGRIEAEAEAEHASLRLGEGRLFRVVLFDGGPRFRRVLLLAHHLLVDAVSWGLIVDDLSTLVSQALGGSALRLAPKTTSALAWAESLVEAAAAPERAGQATHWLDRPSPDPWVRVPRDREPGPRGNRMGNAVTHSFALDETGTQALVEEATRRLDATPQELLLAAVLLGWCRWADRPGLQLDVEGHGRDALRGVGDVSRTVGWFTTVFPVALELPTGEAGEAVGRAREALARLPGRGATHGLLRYLHPDPALRSRLAGLPRSELLFNYVGSVDALIPPDSSLDRAPEPVGRARSPRAPRAYLLEVNARVERRRLTVDVEYSPDVHDPGTVARFADALGGALEAVSELESLQAGPPGPAPRFELSGLDQEGLGRVAELLADIDET